MPETISHSEIALVEVLNNIVEHAYAKYDGEIAVTWMLTEDEVIFETRDTGRPMPQLQPPNSECPPNDVELDELPEGGFGWFLIRKLSRRLTYERCGPENVVKFAIPRVL